VLRTSSGYFRIFSARPSNLLALARLRRVSSTKKATQAPKFAAYSVATGKPRLLYQLPGAYGIGLADVLWTSPTGSTLLGSVYTQATWGHGPVNQTAGLLTNGTFKPVKFPLTAVPFAGEITF
jgi:hypothetical protein